MTDALIIGFGVFTIAMGAAVVLARNAVYSSFALILCFFGLSAVYVLWNATFIATIQILIYTGAIVVLFVFVVMLLNLGRSSLLSYGTLAVTAAGTAIWLLSFTFLRVLTKGYGQTESKMLAGNLRSLSQILFSNYLWPFEALSVFLLAMMVAIFVLAKERSTT